MFNIHVEEIEWAGKPLRFETGRVARQADGAVMVTYGETTVLATAVAARSPKPGLDFFPLTVNYQEKTYAAGKIPGGFFKREARPSEKETLVSRLIDRPIRPLFPKGFKCETQIITTVISHDLENDPDIVALVATSAALTLSGIPFMGPIGAARVGYIDGEYVINPTTDEKAESSLDLVVAGTQDAVLMVESEADELPEQVMLDAVMAGHKEFQPVIDAIIRLAEKAAREPRDLVEEDNSALLAQVAELAESDLRSAYAITTKEERTDKVAEAKDAVLAKLCPADSDEAADKTKVGDAFKSVEKKIVRGNIIETGKRIDERGLADVRAIKCEVGILPRAHGSALFTRGETQALVVTTLGTGDDEQFIDSLEGTYKESFMLHYNFPPYSVGEVGRMGFTGRREIGHGKLAWRAMHPMMPSTEQFPYTIRVVSEITESNGSSSMASVCGTSLALMDAGVPIKASVAGIAMGLVKEGDNFVVLSDILGDEDHLGDMDFKVAGTTGGITALQMDIKIEGITQEIMQIALNQAKAARTHILSVMDEAIGGHRDDISQFAPRIHTMKVPQDKIRDIIGKGGATIRQLTEETGTTIEIEDDGTVKIAATDGEQAKDAIARITALTAEIEVGTIYTGKVVRIVDFGAFVNVLPGKDGLVHISQISEERVNAVSDVLTEGQDVTVKVLEVDRQGRVRLSMKEAAEKPATPAPEADNAE